jgi:hypothetical protein
MISEQSIGKYLEGSNRGLILRYYPGILLEKLGISTRNLRIAGLGAEI